jgi:hypothetical protein
MTVKLVLLKSGEDIIADVQEMVVGDEDSKRVVGYFFDKPCIIKMRDPNLLPEEEKEDSNGRKAAYQVSLYPWMPLSKDTKIPVTAEWVVTITEPIEKLKEMYTQDVINYGKEDNQSNRSDERAEFTDSN